MPAPSFDMTSILISVVPALLAALSKPIGIAIAAGFAFFIIKRNFHAVLTFLGFGHRTFTLTNKDTGLSTFIHQKRTFDNTFIRKPKPKKRNKASFRFNW